VWTKETDAYEAFTPLAFAAACTRTARLGTAIASLFTRGPALLAMQAASLADAAPGRFVLGIGTSSRPIVSGWNGIAFERPLTRTRETLAVLRRALRGERVDFAGEAVRMRGFRLATPPAVPPPIALGALGPRMLALAAVEADAVVLSLVGPDDVPRIRSELAAAASGRPGGPRAREVVIRIGTIVDDDAERARAQCRRTLAAYLSVDRYAALHRWLGRAESLEPMWRAWRAGDRASAVAAVPDALVDALFVHGDVEACRRGLAHFREAGVTTPVVSLLRWPGDAGEVLAELARPA